jgi:hypothetical protein
MFKVNDLVRIIRLEDKIEHIPNQTLASDLKKTIGMIVRVSWINTSGRISVRFSEPFYETLSWYSFEPECLELVYESD